MARPLRIQYPGAYYHVMNRGNRREDIFVTDTNVFRDVVDKLYKDKHSYPI